MLGKISNDKLLYMDNPEVEIFIANLVEYALVRDLYRDYKKELSRNMEKEFSK